MKSIIFFIALTLLVLSQVMAQEVQWSSTVLEYSSQQTDRDFSAQQVLGKPNVLPASGENKNAWQPVGDGEQFIKVGFQTPVLAKQIVIAESNHPGYITKILVYDSTGKEKEVTSYQAKYAGTTSRLLLVKTTDINIKIAAVKVLFTTVKNIPIGIDAIGITASSKAVKIKADEASQIKASVKSTALSANVNSPYPEMGPLVSPDGKTLYFSRRGDPSGAGGASDMEDIFFAEWDEKKKMWGPAQNIGAPLNNAEPNFINSISPDGNTVLLGNTYNEDGTEEDGVSISHRTANGWSFPEKLNIEDDNNKSVNANFFLSNNQKILLLSIERKGDTKGDRDLYVSFKGDNSTWTKPQNLGGIVNTTGVEAAPFLASDDRTLYFSSTGLGGYGGSDIFVTRRQDDSWTNWSKPENLGGVINNDKDQSFLSITASGEKVYFTSEGSKSGDDDIRVITLPSALQPSAVTLIRGKVLNSKTNEAIPGVHIIFENLETGTEVGTANSSPVSGIYQIALPSKSKYGYLAEKAGFISVHDNIDLKDQSLYAEAYKDLYLTPIETGQTITFKNVFFDFDKAELKKESYLELNRLVTILKNNPGLDIEIAGHADNKGSEKYNDELSARRAEAVASYLLDKSALDKTRIVVKHYGESSPSASNATEKGRQLNRRVEFKIIKATALLNQK